MIIDYFYRFAEICTKEKDFKGAIKNLDKCIEIDPEQNLYYYQKAKLNKLLGNYQQALNDFTKCNEIYPCPDSLKDRGLIFFDLGQYKEAIKDFTELIKYIDDDYENWSMRGFANYELGQYEEAIKDFTEAINLHQNSKKLIYARGLCKKALKRYRDADKDFEDAKLRDMTSKLISKKKKYTKKNENIIINDFERTSIINFPKSIYYLKKNNLSKSAPNLENIKNYSDKTILHKIEKFPNWHIKTFKDFYKLTEDIKNIPRKSKYRNLEELLDILSIINEEKIELFISKDQEKFDKRFLAQFYKEYNFIVINGAFLFDIDKMCESLSHELIHYFQKDNIFAIDIHDSVVPFVLNSDLYKNNSPIDLQKEFEAYTYEKYPNFIPKFYKNNNILTKEFAVSSNRLKTIKWISENKGLPNYPPNSYPSNKLNFKSFMKKPPKNQIEINTKQISKKDFESSLIYLPEMLFRTVTLRLGFDGGDPLTYDEVADLVGYSIRTIKSWERECIKKIKKIIDQEAIYKNLFYIEDL